jgi:MinD-like ATPase involved in chromosome partitioning or flagellar assembly
LAADCSSHVFLVLLRDRDCALRIRDRLAAAFVPAQSAVARFLVPDDGLRGDAFFSQDPQVQERLDRWWTQHVDGDLALGADPCVVALVECTAGPGRTPRFERLAGGALEVDGVARIGGDRDGDALCDLVLDTYANRPDRPAEARLFVAPCFSREDGRAGVGASCLAATADMPTSPRALTVATEELPTRADPATTNEPALTIERAAAARSHSARAPRRSLLDRAAGRALGLVGRGPRELDLGRHAQWLMHPDYRAPVILVTNPKGGPGKTTTAIGLALILNEILEAAHANGRVVLVDGNTRMSDTFRSMPVGAGAPTVRELTTLLRQAPEAIGELQYANSRARNLVVLREQEDSGGYQLQEIEDLARYLREHFCAIVVDLVNDRPGTGSPTERLVQWWLTQGSVVVVPAKANLNDLEGAERMVAARQGLPAVLAYIQPPQRDLDGHPRIQERLERLRGQVAGVHAVPEDYRVRTAALDNLNLVDAAPRLREAFAELTLGVLAVHADGVYRRLCAGLQPAVGLDAMALR